MPPGTTGHAATSARPELATAALAAWLQDRIEGMKGPLLAQRFNGGQSNPTFLLTDALGQRYVLRKKPDGELLPSAHAVDREYRVMKALEGTEVPVARMLVFCDDPAVIGTAFYVMEFVEGRIFWDPALPELDSAGRAAVYADMNRVIAALHRLDPGAVGLGDFGKSSGFFERQLGRWSKQYRASQTEPIPAMEHLIEWLPLHIPAAEETRIFHGDLRLDNMIFHPTQPRILAVLDWELSTLGHPLADFAYHALPWRLTSEQFRGMAEKDVASLGIPSEDDYLRKYCAATGREVNLAEYEFCVAYSMFRLAAILQGILKRSLDGTASNECALTTGKRARVIAEAAWQQVARAGWLR
jgi:aminoglycoside phosphotransferase (APT) family kinase protein